MEGSEIELVVARQEGLRAGLARVLEHFIGRALFVDHAIGNEQHAVGHVVGKSQLVRHQQQGAAFVGQRADHAQNKITGLTQKERILSKTFPLFLCAMSFVKQIPNALTCANLLSGCAAILSAMTGQWHHAAIYLLASLLFDFLDGFAARILNANSPIGKQLDSLADMVTFGFLPGVILFQLFLKSNFFILIDNWIIFNLLKYFFFANTICAALRLAKFNLDTRQTNYFLGLPTPANTMFIASLPLMVMHDQFGLKPYILNPMVLVGICILFSVLMITEIPLIALKFKNFKWKDNQPQFILLLLSVILLPVLQFAAIPVIILCYITLSLIFKNKIISFQKP